jgi:hypothetical protein
MKENPMIRMLSPRQAVLLTAIASTSIALHGASLEPIRENCTISAGTKAGTLRLHTDDGDCPANHNCGNNMSDVPPPASPASRWPILPIRARTSPPRWQLIPARSPALEQSPGGELSGNSVFTPDAAFVARMEKMGFTGYDSEKLLPYTYLDVRSDWAQSLKQMGIRRASTPTTSSPCACSTSIRLRA